MVMTAACGFSLSRILGKQKVGREHWVPDERAANCTGCGKEFRAFVRKHHCRSCGNIFCRGCSGLRIPLHMDHYKEGQEKEKRVCAECYTRVQEVRRSGGTYTVQHSGQRPPQLPQPAANGASGAIQRGASTGSAGSSEFPAPPAAPSGGILAAMRGSKPSVDFAAPVDSPEELSSPVWGALDQSQPALAEALRACEALTHNSVRFENECEQVLRSLRSAIRRCPRRGSQSDATASLVNLDDLPVKASVWRFLQLIESRRPWNRGQAEELAAQLRQSEAWVKAAALVAPDAAR